MAEALKAEHLRQLDQDSDLELDGDDSETVCDSSHDNDVHRAPARACSATGGSEHKPLHPDPDSPQYAAASPSASPERNESEAPWSDIVSCLSHSPNIAWKGERLLVDVVEATVCGFSWHLFPHHLIADDLCPLILLSMGSSSIFLFSSFQAAKNFTSSLSSGSLHPPSTIITKPVCDLAKIRPHLFSSAPPGPAGYRRTG